MASPKKKDYKVKNSNNNAILKNLKDMYANVVHPDIIESVVKGQKWNVDSTCRILSGMVGNVSQKPAQRCENSGQRKGHIVSLNTISYGTVQEDDDVDVLIESVSSPPSTNQAVRSGKSPARRSRRKPQGLLDRTIASIIRGECVMIILRGLPGSGKSELARTIVQASYGTSCNPQLYAFSTDDYFMRGKQYRYSVVALHEAHVWNQKRVSVAARNGLSPLIIDNTNTQAWEMRPYVVIAVQYGYRIELLEPTTPWAWQLSELARRNLHQVPRQRISDMADRFERGLTPEKLLTICGMRYAPGCAPPQQRLVPPPPPHSPRNSRRNPHLKSATISKDIDKSSCTEWKNVSEKTEEESKSILENQGCANWESDNEGTWEELDLLGGSPSAGYILVDSTKDVQPTIQQDLIDLSDCPVKPISLPELKAGFGVSEVGDKWQELLPAMDFIVPEPEIMIKPPDIPKNEVATNTEDPIDEAHILIGKARDINTATIPVLTLRVPPRVLMLDKSTMADEAEEIKGQNNHLPALLALFPFVRQDVLQDILDKCCGDIHWAVDLLLESVGSTSNIEVACNAFSTTLQPELLTEIVNKQTVPMNSTSESKQIVETENSAENLVTKTSSRHRVWRPADEILKKYIDFKIGDEHYSEHVLSVRRQRHGKEELLQILSNEEESDVQVVGNEHLSEDEDSEYEEPVELHLGLELVKQLDSLYGDSRMNTEGLHPVVQAPAALARQLYALWLQSASTQTEAQRDVLESMERQDRELARELQAAEEREIEIRNPPSLMEIMDMELALAVYRAEQKRWLNDTPQDLASRLTRTKLHEAFPELQPELLNEILQAHGNSFQQTVESLECSVGRTAISTDQLWAVETRLREERQKEKDQEANEGERVTSKEYRNRAARHLSARNELFTRAQASIRRGLPQVAAHYSDIARLHMQRYEEANIRAACALLAEQNQDIHTIDLHYLYVREAEQALAIFLDSHVVRLREKRRQNVALYIITGRGARSVGGISHIKPAVQRRLCERRLRFTELNPGLLKVVVTKNSALTNDLRSSE